MSLLERNKTYKEVSKDKILPLEDLLKKLQELRSKGKSVVTLNGSFDLLHAGHLEMLYQASLQGDILVVALNTDASIQGYKGPKRPIVPLEGRAQMVAALEMVDFVTSFSEADPKKLLSQIKPDVHVNGSEYGKDCIEAEVVKEHGGKVHIVSLVPGLSTTALLRKIVEVSS